MRTWSWLLCSTAIAHEDEEFALLAKRTNRGLEQDQQVDTLLQQNLDFGSSTSLMASLQGMGRRNLTHTLSVLQSVAQENLEGNGIDKAIRLALKEIKEELVGDIRTGLKGEHTLDQTAVNSLNDCFDQCETKLKEDKASISDFESQVTNHLNGHKTCRENVLDLYTKKIETCEELDTAISNLRWPSGVNQQCLWGGDPSSDAVLKALKDGQNWYSRNHAAMEKAHQACSDAVDAYEVADNECDITQRSFESATCALRQSEWTTCNDHHMSCCSDCTAQFHKEVERVECAEGDRKLDWAAVDKIECYVDVLIDSPTNEQLHELCKDKGSSCMKEQRVKAYKACDSRCEAFDVDHGEYTVVDGVNTTHRTKKDSDDERCTRDLDIHFPLMNSCEDCKKPEAEPCSAEFTKKHYSTYMATSWIDGIDKDTKKCKGYSHEEKSAYSLGECKPCANLFGEDPTKRNVSGCWSFGDEIRITSVDSSPLYDKAHSKNGCNGKTWLNMGELIVNNGEDLRISMSSLYDHTKSLKALTQARNCVDGKEDTFCSTGCDTRVWLSARLAKPMCLDSIKIVNRRDCCDGQLVGSNIEVLNHGVRQWSSHFAAKQALYTWKLPGVCESYGDEVFIQSTDETQGLWQGKYVVLNIAELTVNNGEKLELSMFPGTAADKYTIDKCTDGNEDNMCHSYPYTTQADGGYWLSAKLAKPTCINSIKVVNRKDCCQDRIVGTRVAVRLQGNSVWTASFTKRQSTYTWNPTPEKA